MVSWQRGSNGSVPCGAVWAGHDIDGTDMYVGRARHEQDLLPGKVVPSKGGMFVSYSCSEHSKFQYEVLCSSCVAWQHCSHGRVPPRAVVGGHTASGEQLYVARAMHLGSFIPGKVHGSHGKCYVPFDGRELSFNHYEVLITV